jgi:hypothetical protein
MVSLILIIGTLLFCFGLFVIFRLNQNSKNIEYKVETLQFSEYREYQDSLITGSLQGSEKEANDKIIANILAAQQEIVTALIDKYYSAFKDLSANATSPTSRKIEQLETNKINTAIKSLGTETGNAIGELEKVKESISNLKTSFSDRQALREENEEQRRRAAERIQKLRNLSFNVNPMDPNNDYENVPAYIRRNLELFNTVSPAENFYSNYEVKKDEDSDSGSEIKRDINTFLDGRKAD